MGTARAPVAGSGFWPACSERVLKPMARSEVASGISTMITAENSVSVTMLVAMVKYAIGILFCGVAALGQTAPSRITVDPAQRYQIIDGFGLNFTAPYFRDDQKRMFDQFIDDLGVTMFRVVPYLVASDWEVVND